MSFIGIELTYYTTKGYTFVENHQRFFYIYIHISTSYIQAPHMACLLLY